MPVGAVDYRARLGGPGSTEALGLALRGAAMPGTGQPDVALDPEGQAALMSLFGGTSRVHVVDSYARGVSRTITAPPSKPAQDVPVSGLQRFITSGGVGGSYSVLNQMLEHEKLVQAAMVGGLAAPPSDPAISASGLAVAGNFDFTGQVGRSVIKDWRWAPEAEVAAKVGTKVVPEHVVEFGGFMQDMAGKAARGELTSRDLIKAFTITRSSIQRSAQSVDKLRERWPDFPGTGGKVRPEGAFSEWLLTPTGNRYLDNAEQGMVDGAAIADAKAKLGGFGKDNDLVAALTAAPTLRGQEGAVGEMIAQAAAGPGKGLDAWRAWTKSLPGIGPAKSGFIGSMLGRGDLPTFDARQIQIQTGRSSAEAQPFLRRAGGLGADQAVDRLVARQKRMALELPLELEPFRQHLTHHTIWDAVAGETTTHGDLIRALRLAGLGGLAAGLTTPQREQANEVDRRAREAARGGA